VGSTVIMFSEGGAKEICREIELNEIIRPRTSTDQSDNFELTNFINFIILEIRTHSFYKSVTCESVGPDQNLKSNI
jgi:hypothetical protein